MRKVVGTNPMRYEAEKVTKKVEIKQTKKS